MTDIQNIYSSISRLFGYLFQFKYRIIPNDIYDHELQLQFNNGFRLKFIIMTNSIINITISMKKDNLTYEFYSRLYNKSSCCNVINRYTYWSVLHIYIPFAIWKFNTIVEKKK